jgi:hypothetical protein
MSRGKRRIHITIANPLADALEALAGLEGRTISELIDDIGRQHLRAQGYEPRITSDDISTVLTKRGSEGSSDRRKKK